METANTGCSADGIGVGVVLAVWKRARILVRVRMARGVGAATNVGADIGAGVRMARGVAAGGSGREDECVRE